MTATTLRLANTVAHTMYSYNTFRSPTSAAKTCSPVSYSLLLFPSRDSDIPPWTCPPDISSSRTILPVLHGVGRSPSTITIRQSTV